ncbi:magnesium/cobalt transporter CorA [Leptolyngbya sp. FACHB-16]|uniref:magnesium/cobalt transporter CorA n=1 Tax=unclassified Leptolyngbya TaxID=2650499 RepID=UPI00168683AB|nr:magnesium/cobalt transporter CorA [Leptolyngbya sp. FACHB-16]MBD2152915.1 magnesium/cobalt transporter CorA [Leptolyngbya sp. FACHB-16]
MTHSNRRSVNPNRADYFQEQPGSIPGTLQIRPDAPPPKIVLIDYNKNQATKVDIEKPADCAPYLDTESVSWVDVQGLGGEETWYQLGQVFHLHPLVLEDIINVPQRPKVEEYEDQLVIIARMVTLHEHEPGFVAEQISLILGKHYLLTVQEEPVYDCLGALRERIRTGKGSIRTLGADHLAYALLDAIIDGFFPVLEVYGELIENLEEEVVENPTRQTLEKIHRVKRELLTLRRAIWPQREALNTLIRDGSDLISDDVRLYLRDCYDHSIQILDMLETYRELVSSLMDVYLSSVSNRMNEVMKTLTVISSIFIPLTFIAGIYGMNFNTEESPWNMPELNWYWGYPATLAFMLGVAMGMGFFFWHRGWFSSFSTLKVNSTHRDSSTKKSLR